MENNLPVGKIDMSILSPILKKYTTEDERVVVGPKIGEDAAVVDFGDRYMVTKLNPITFATSDIGWYVVNVCVNNMVVRGVDPKWMLNCILLPEKSTTKQLIDDIFKQIFEASQKLGITIIGGHTEITYGLNRPIIVGQLIGEIGKDELVTTSGAKVGDTIFVTKALGVEGTAIIASELEETLLEKGYTSDFIATAKNFLYEPGISIALDAKTAYATGYPSAMTDATEGGLASSLHEMASAGNIGVLIEADKVPVLPETVKICEEFNLNPFGLIASGMMIMTAAPENEEALLSKMEIAGVQCTAIGKVTDSSEGLKIKTENEIKDLPYYAVDELTKIL
jgi:hydrogenase expression/formation protein HypE